MAAFLGHDCAPLEGEVGGETGTSNAPRGREREQQQQQPLRPGAPSPSEEESDPSPRDTRSQKSRRAPSSQTMEAGPPGEEAGSVSFLILLCPLPSNPLPVYSKVSPIVPGGSYSQDCSLGVDRAGRSRSQEASRAVGSPAQPHRQVGVSG